MVLVTSYGYGLALALAVPSFSAVAGWAPVMYQQLSSACHLLALLAERKGPWGVTLALPHWYNPLA